MRVLILSQYYTPEPVDKFADLARGLRQLGHEVQVITGFPCYPYGRIYDGYRQSIYREESIDGVQVTRLPQIPDHSKSIIKRVLYYVSFAISAVTIGLVRAKRADVMLVYQSALPIGLAAWTISRLKRIPYVLDVVDLWPESVAATGMVTNRFALGIIRRLVRFIYRGAIHINVITNGYRQNLRAMGVPDAKMSLIHCWPPAGKFDRVDDDDQRATHEQFDGRFNVVYAGAMGPSQNLETVIEASLRLQDLADVQFALAGTGVEHDRLVQLAKEKGAQNVRFLGQLPPEEIQKIYAVADLLLVHLKPNAMSKVSIPSKTFSYMAAGRPIVMAVAGESARLVEQHGCGVAVTPSDPAELAAAVRQLYSMTPEKRQDMADAALAAYRSNYCSEVQIHKFAERLDAAAYRKAA